MRCGYCKMRFSRCHCRRQKPDAKEKSRAESAVEVELPKGQTTIYLIGASPRVQLRWWGQWKPAPNLLKTDDKAPSAFENS
jgi:hypothetical protein